MSDPLDDWHYDLPPDRIAVRPLARRDASRLMLLPRDGGALQHLRFDGLPDLLRPGDLLVVNDSRVMAARLRATRATSGRVEVLLLQADGDVVPALLKPARRLSVGEVLEAPGGHVVVEALPDEEGIARVRPVPSAQALMSAGGELPLPPYLGRPADEADSDRYQTVYAAHTGSAAAPTAGLHFTEALLGRLGGAGIGVARVTLHVGIGTFRPLRPEDVARGELHEEPWTVPEETARAIAEARAAGGRVIAVGTTAARTLESAWQGGAVRAGTGTTSLFIRPPHAVRSFDGLITNFHLPRSSLMMLVAALCSRERLLEAYAEAVTRGYRFYSYGDAMLLV